MDELLKLKTLPAYDLGSTVLSEFSRLKDVTYLDHTASTLYSERQIAEYAQSLVSNLCGNPHSRHESSEFTTQNIEGVRQRILEHFNTTAEDYAMIFTSGATDALKLIAYNFQWHQQTNGKQIDSKLDTQNGAFIYTQENHTSVLGIRANAIKEKAYVSHVSAKDVYQKLDSLDEINSDLSNYKSDCNNALFAYPAQCNYSGSKYPLSWIPLVQNRCLSDLVDSLEGCHLQQDELNWFVILDAASYVATNPLDLSQWKPDFVPVSFYKIFGYPTGIGCLLVSKRAWHTLDKTYYGGGTVRMIQARGNKVIPRTNILERFEDGTLPFLNILALNVGFDTIKRITGSMRHIQNHVYNLAYYVYYFLRSIKHYNGTRVAQIHSQSEHWTAATQGSIVNFSLFNSDGSAVGYAYVEEMASLFNIHLRTGCVCSPGACQKYLDISLEDLDYQFKMGHSCGDAHDLVDGRPTGSVRISFGYMSTYSDADQFIRMIKEAFIEGEMMFDSSWMNSFAYSLANISRINSNEIKTNGYTIEKSLNKQSTNELKINHTRNEKDCETNFIINARTTKSNVNITDKLPTTKEPIEKRDKIRKLYLTNIFIYPIKSCCGMEVQSWEIGDEGLLYDRKWMVVNNLGTTMTLKRLPQLSLIKPKIDLNNLTLHLSSPGHDSISIGINKTGTVVENHLCNGRVCGDRIVGEDCGDAVSYWLSRVLDKPGLRLFKKMSDRKSKLGKENDLGQTENISLANESQFLILHRASVRKLLADIPDNKEHTEELLLQRFRGNLVVEGGDAYEEDSWTNFNIGKQEFQIQSQCRRCQIIGVVPGSGERSKEPMRTLALSRGSNMYFGIHASCIRSRSSPAIHTGLSVSLNTTN